MKEIKLNVNAVKACLLTAGKKDCREMMNGVFIDMDLVSVVGTNGDCLTVSKPHKFVQIIQNDEDDKHIILHRDSLEQFFKVIPKKTEEFIVLILDDGSVKYKTDVLEFNGSRIKGFRFPDWKRIYPSDRKATEQGSLAFVSPHHIALLGKMASLWSTKEGTVLIQFDGRHNSILCSLNNDDLHILMMPMLNPNGRSAVDYVNYYFKNDGV